MRWVRSGGSRRFETTDAIADALLDCDWALADAGRTGIAQVPVVADDGGFVDLGLLLGTGSALTVEAVDPTRADPEPTTVLALRLAAIRATAAAAAQERFRR